MIGGRMVVVMVVVTRVGVPAAEKFVVFVCLFYFGYVDRDGWNLEGRSGSGVAEERKR